MSNTAKNDAKNVRKPVRDHEPMITDFGTRAICNQNFSKMVALPKTALANCGADSIAQVNVKLVQDKKERYIKLTPVYQTRKGDK